MKATPKSCSCAGCRRGKRSKRGKYLMSRMDRAVRAAWRNQHGVDPEQMTSAPAPTGNYFD